MVFILRQLGNLSVSHIFGRRNIHYCKCTAIRNYSAHMTGGRCSPRSLAFMLLTVMIVNDVILVTCRLCRRQSWRCLDRGPFIDNKGRCARSGPFQKCEFIGRRCRCSLSIVLGDPEPTVSDIDVFDDEDVFVEIA